MFKKSVFVAVLISLLFVVNVQAFTYEMTYYVEGGTGASIDTDDVPFLAINGDTNLSLNMRASFNTSSSYTYTGQFKSPIPTTIATNEGSGSTNVSCHNLGSFPKEYVEGGGLVETEVSMTNDADIATIYSIASYVVNTDDQYLDVFSFANVDSDGFVPNIYYQRVCEAESTPTQNEITSKFTAAMFTDCGGMVPTRTPATIGTGSCGGNVNKRYEYVVVNSTAGNVSYYITSDASAHFVVYPVDNPAGVATLCGESANCGPGSVVLDENELYVFAFGTRGYSSPESVGHFNLTVDLGIPKFSCGSWSACEDGEHQRTCTDDNGLQPPKIEAAACSVVVLENATLGFEEFYTDFALKCLPTWFLGCGWSIENITRDTPTGWTVSEDFLSEGLQRDFLRMTSDWSSEGSRSLMMWHIPPKEGEPITNTTCGNVTTGTVPVISQDVSNTTFSVDFDVTFPATNMLLSTDVKGCNEQVLHHDPITTLFGVVELCPGQCYSGNCSSIPDAEFQIILRDSNGAIMTNYYGSADNYQSTTVEMDLTGIGIVAGENYTIQIQGFPENRNSQAGNCIMFDNMKYEVLADPYLDLIGGDCSVGNQCIGSTLYETHLYENGACSVIRIEVSPECATGDKKDKIEARENFCEDNNILFSFDMAAGLWKSTTCDYICYEDECLTQAEYDGEVAPTPETTDEMLAALYNNIVPVVMSFLIMFICVIIALKRDHAWPLGLFGIAQFVFVLSIIGVLSPWFAVGEIVLAAVIFAYFVSKPGGSG